MPEILTRKLVVDHLVEGEARRGKEIALRIDQVLMHDAQRSCVRTATGSDGS